MRYILLAALLSCSVALAQTSTVNVNDCSRYPASCVTVPPASNPLNTYEQLMRIRSMQIAQQAEQQRLNQKVISGDTLPTHTDTRTDAALIDENRELRIRIDDLEHRLWQMEERLNALERQSETKK